MSQQINLYEARLRPRDLLLTGRRLAGTLAAVVVLVVALSFVVRQQATQARAEATAVQTELKSLQDRHDALVKQMAERQIPMALQGELDRARMVLSMRKEVVALLDSGKLGNTDGFSSLLYGFARHAAADWWITGVAIGLGGQEIEIRGKLLDAAKLPAYVQRLSQDSAFQGRRFAALTVTSADAADAKPETPLRDADRPDSRLPRHVDFTLRSERGAGITTATEAGK